VPSSSRCCCPGTPVSFRGGELDDPYEKAGPFFLPPYEVLGQTLNRQYLLARHAGISITETNDLALPELDYFWTRFVEENKKQAEAVRPPSGGAMRQLKDGLLDRFSFLKGGGR
jgi:hypothetical protein